MVLESTPAQEIPKHFLEQSISLVERSSLKMLPVVREVRRRVVNSEVPPADYDKKKKHHNSSAENDGNGNDVEPEDPDDDDDDDDEDMEEEKPDMRSVLGFLNQNEWIFNLNIGNIMQIQPLSMKDFM